MIEVDAFCTVSELKSAVQRKFGILCGQQRLVIKGTHFSALPLPELP